MISKKLPINEYFETLQGEATYQGTPSMFIRFQGCPVGCAFCDTKYTWHIEKEHEVESIDQIKQKELLDFTKGEGNPSHYMMEPNDILKLCEETNVNHVVLTGGEPCMYDLTYLTWLLHNANRYQTGSYTKRFTTQIETSGTFHVQTHSDTWVTVSPKIGKSIAGGLPLVPQALKRANEIKYPVGKQQDIDNLKDLIEEYDLDKKQIWLQPLSVNEKTTELCIEQCMLNNWRLSVQTHKYVKVR